MHMTGKNIFCMLSGTASKPRGLSATLPEARYPAGLKYRCAAAAAAFLVTVAAPLAIDLPAGAIAWHAAYAGSGDGNYGNGKGNGGANGQDPGKNGQNNGGNGGSGDGGNGGGGDGGDGGGGDGGGGDGGDGGNDDGADTGPDTITDDVRDHDSGTDQASELADNEVSQSIEAAGGLPAEGPVAGMPAAGLPTISQLFSLGDDATISAEEELQLISNGWKSN